MLKFKANFSVSAFQYFSLFSEDALDIDFLRQHVD